MTEEQVEDEKTRYYKLGIIEGFRQSSNKIQEFSVHLFRADKDAQALEAKKLSKMLLEMSVTRQEIHDKEYPKDD